MNPLHSPIAIRAFHRCEYCRAPELVSNLEWEVEHIQPISAGGTDDLQNLALACRSCNVHKSNRQVCLDPQTRETVPLFHPRRDLWTEHFTFDGGSGELLGLTPTGRATVACLRMNRTPQTVARLLWVRMGLYP